MSMRTPQHLQPSRLIEAASVHGPSWLGVDVGGSRKGFDAALIDDHELVLLRSRLTSADAADLALSGRPAVVAIDSPCCFASAEACCRRHACASGSATTAPSTSRA
jgi:hypothetical protein